MYTLQLGTPRQSTEQSGKTSTSKNFSSDARSLAPGAMEWQPTLLQLLEESYPALQYTGWLPLPPVHFPNVKYFFVGLPVI